MKIVFTTHGWEDYTSWAEDKKVLRRVNRLIAEAARDPAQGPGSPNASVEICRGTGHGGSTRSTGSSTPSSATS